MNMNSKMIALAVVAIFSISTMMVSANVSHGSSPAACEADGYEAGRDGAFSQELYETCEEVDGADAYYQGFIDGVCL